MADFSIAAEGAPVIVIESKIANAEAATPNLTWILAKQLQSRHISISGPLANVTGARLATAFQSSRRVAGFDSEQRRQWHFQRFGEPVQHINGRVFLAPFHAAKIGAIHPRIECEPLLRYALRNAYPPHIPADQIAPAHGVTQAFLLAIKPLSISIQLDDGGGEMFRRGAVGLLCLALLSGCIQSDHDKLLDWLSSSQTTADKAKLRNFVTDVQARINSDSSDDQKIADIQALGMEEERYLDAHVLTQPPHFSGSSVQDYADQYYLTVMDARKNGYQMAKDLIYLSKYESCCQVRDDIAAASQAASKVKETKQRLMIAAGFSEIEQNQNL